VVRTISVELCSNALSCCIVISSVCNRFWLLPEVYRKQQSIDVICPLIIALYKSLYWIKFNYITLQYIWSCCIYVLLFLISLPSLLSFLYLLLHSYILVQLPSLVSFLFLLPLCCPPPPPLLYPCLSFLFPSLVLPSCSVCLLAHHCCLSFSPFKTCLEKS